MELTSLPERTDPAIKPLPERKFRQHLRTAGILGFGFAVFTFFLLMKLPEARIQNLAIAYCRIFSQNYGLLFSAEKVSLAVFPLPGLRFYNVELKSGENDKQFLKVPFLRVRPQFLPLFWGSKKASIYAEVLGGEVSGSLGIGKGTSLSVSIDSVDFATVADSATLIEKYVPVSITSGKLDGDLDIDLDLEKTQNTEGKIKFTLKKLSMPAQSVSGFQLPKINIGETHAEVSISKGQFIFRKVELGKALPGDDLVAILTGDGEFGRVLEQSKINAKITFEFSSNVKNAVPLLDALIGNAKNSEGKYVFRVSGPLFSPQIVPANL